MKQLTRFPLDEALAHLKMLSQFESPSQDNLSLFRKVFDEVNAFLGPDADAWMNGNDLITVTPSSARVSNDQFSRWVLYTLTPFFNKLVGRRFRVRIPYISSLSILLADSVMRRPSQNPRYPYSIITLITGL